RTLKLAERAFRSGKIQLVAFVALPPIHRLRRPRGCGRCSTARRRAGRHGAGGGGGGEGGGGTLDAERGGAGFHFGQAPLIFRVELRVAALGQGGLAADEQGFHVGGRLEDVTGGDDNVGALAGLERADAV